MWHGQRLSVVVHQNMSLSLAIVVARSTRHFVSVKGSSHPSRISKCLSFSRKKNYHWQGRVENVELYTDRQAKTGHLQLRYGSYDPVLVWAGFCIVRLYKREPYTYSSCTMNPQFSKHLMLISADSHRMFDPILTIMRETPFSSSEYQST